MLNIEVNYQTFIAYLTHYIERDGIEEFVEWLETTDIKTAPASSKYALSEVGGLIQHSLNVFLKVVSLFKEEYGEEDFPYSKESIALVSLLHDISKLNYYEVAVRNVKNEDGEWVKEHYYKVRDQEDRLFYGSAAENTLYILRSFFKLTYEEELAILYHGGVFDTNSSPTNVMNAFCNNKLALFLHLADMYATCNPKRNEFVEEDESEEESEENESPREEDEEVSALPSADEVVFQEAIPKDVSKPQVYS